MAHSISRRITLEVRSILHETDTQPGVELHERVEAIVRESAIRADANAAITNALDQLHGRIDLESMADSIAKVLE